MSIFWKVALVLGTGIFAGVVTYLARCGLPPQASSHRTGANRGQEIFPYPYRIASR